MFEGASAQMVNLHPGTRQLLSEIDTIELSELLNQACLAQTPTTELPNNDITHNGD